MICRLACTKYVLDGFCRLNMSFEQGSPKKGRGAKRKRVTIDPVEQSLLSSGYKYVSKASAKGAIEIHDTDHTGKFIKLFNTGDDVSF